MLVLTLRKTHLKPKLSSGTACDPFWVLWVMVLYFTYHVAQIVTTSDEIISVGDRKKNCWYNNEAPDEGGTKFELGAENNFQVMRLLGLSVFPMIKSLDMWLHADRI